jgi:deoxyribonuclease-4
MTDEFLNYLSNNKVGNHISDPSSLLLFPVGSTVQFYLTDVIRNNLQNIRDYANQHQLRIYVHGYLQNNLTNPSMYFTNKFLEEIRIAKYLGARGLVIHMGYVKDDIKENSLRNMYNNIQRLIPEATAECPILLETPAGETNRLCSDFPEMLMFTNWFTAEERAVLGMCLDTAHVWGAGYQPDEYLNAWIKHSTFPIKLVHFNDSKVDRNSKKDRHARPGEGTIGIPQLYSVFNFCSTYNIPMVREN